MIDCDTGTSPEILATPEQVNEVVDVHVCMWTDTSPDGRLPPDSVSSSLRL